MIDNFNNFDSHFKKTKRTIGIAFFIGIFFKILIGVALVFGVVRLFHYINDNDTSIVKESGKIFQNIQNDFKEGQAIAKDTIILDTLKVK